MKQYLEQAHAEVASHCAVDQGARFDTVALKRFVVASAVGLGIAFSNSPAHAMDKSTLGTIVGGALGTMLSAKATKNSDDYTIKAGALAIGAAGGAWAGKELAERMDAPRAEVDTPRSQTRPDGYSTSRQPAREVVIVERVVSAPVSRVDDRQWSRAPLVHQEATRGQGPALFSAEASGFSTVLAASLNRAQAGLVSSGSRDLASNSTLKGRIATAADRLLSSANAYGRSVASWDDAASLVGSEGLAARNKAIESLAASRKALDERSGEYAQVRNVLAQQGFDVRAVDRAVSAQTQHLSEPTAYVFNRPSMRP